MHTLPKEERLRKKSDFDLLFSKAQSIKAAGIKLQYTIGPLPKGEAAVQVAFAVPKKVFRLATKRNRVKRLLRDCYRLQKADLNAHANLHQLQIKVLFIFRHSQVPLHAELAQKMQSLLGKLLEAISQHISA